MAGATSMNSWAKYGLIAVFCLGVFTATFVTLELTLGQDHHLDAYSEERFRQRPPPPRHEEKSMGSNELIDLVQNLGSYSSRRIEEDTETVVSWDSVLFDLVKIHTDIFIAYLGMQELDEPQNQDWKNKYSIL